MFLRKLLKSDDRPWREIRLWLAPRLLRLFHSGLMATLRFQTSGMHQLEPFVSPQAQREFKSGQNPRPGALLLMWHDHTMPVMHILQDWNVGAMMSASRDGQMQGATWQLYGFPIIWGSTNKKEAISALRSVLKWVSSGGIFGFTPDGPKGPRHQSHGGAVYLASKSGCAVLPMGVAASRFWQMKSWDKYLIPKPFSQVHIHVGPAVHVPPDLSREETQLWQEKITAAINEANRVARAELGLAPEDA